MTPESLIEAFIVPKRIARFRQLAGNHLNCMTLIFENIGEPHNENACMRVADAFGLGTVYRLNVHAYTENKQVSMEGDRWVDVKSVVDTSTLLNTLRAHDFTIVGSIVPGDGGIPFMELPLPKKMALAVGGEHSGLSSEFRDRCDALIHIPTHGFVDSLNLSTATAIMVQHFSERFRAAGRDIYISPEEQNALAERWILRDLRKKLLRKNMVHLLDAALAQQEPPIT